MTDRELHRLSRAALIQLLIEQTEANEALQARVDKLEKQVKNKTIAVSTAGSMADAAMELNNVFSSADKAAQQYLDNLRAANLKSDAIIEDARQQAAKIVSEARAEARRLGVLLETEERPPAPAVSEKPAKRREAAQSKKQEQKSVAGKKTGDGTRAASRKKNGGELDDLFESAFSEMRKNNR